MISSSECRLAEQCHKKKQALKTVWQDQALVEILAKHQAPIDLSQNGFGHGLKLPQPLSY